MDISKNNFDREREHLFPELRYRAGGGSDNIAYTPRAIYNSGVGDCNGRNVVSIGSNRGQLDAYILAILNPNSYSVLDDALLANRVARYRGS